MALFDFLGGLISPVTELIGKVITKDEDRLRVQGELVRIQNEFASKMLDYETKLMDAQSKIIVAEAQGASWAQRNWRPVLMLSIVGIVVNNYLLVPWLQMFGVQAPILELPEHLWTLMTIGVGGYIGGRSVEKIAPKIAEILKAK